MNYDIVFENVRDGKMSVFRIYNATSLLDAVIRFEKSNPGTIVISATRVLPEKLQ